MKLTLMRENVERKVRYGLNKIVNIKKYFQFLLIILIINIVFSHTGNTRPATKPPVSKNLRQAHSVELSW